MYEDYAEKSKALIWKYFLRNTNGETAQCKRLDCKKILKISGGSTKGLHTHLLSVHKEQVNTNQAIDCAKSVIKSTGTIQKYLEQDAHDEKTLNATIARLAAVDGLSFKTICESNDLRRLFKAEGYKNIPTSPNTVRLIVSDYYKKCVDLVKMAIHKAKHTGNFSTKMFSLSFDEWTSISSKRYLNVNLHGRGEVYWNLGLVRIDGSLPAEKCVELLRTTLQFFGLNLETDLISIMTDGASMMKKVAKLLDIHQQLCFAHGIQLAVIDVLYKQANCLAESYETHFIIEKNESSEIEEDFADESDKYENLFINDFTGPQITEKNTRPLVLKVRRIVTLFKKSPTKNDVLQKYIKSEFGKNLMLIKDTKTRWSSLFEMLKRFKMLLSSIQKTLIDLNLTNDEYNITLAETKQIEDMIVVLEPIKLTVDTLCRRDSNLITANIALTFMLQKLRSTNSLLSDKLYNSLCIRLKERSTKLGSLLIYLHYGYLTSDNTNFSFPLLSNAECLELLILLTNKRDEISNGLESKLDETPFSQFIDDKSVILNKKTKITVTSAADELNKALEEGIKPPLQIHKMSVKSLILKEMALFENGGKRGEYLEDIYNRLMSIKPTSVEAERAFSAAGLFATKIRSRLGDQILCELCFLRGFFKPNK